MMGFQKWLQARHLSFAVALLWLAAGAVSTSFGQSTADDIDRHLQFGEFTKAIELAESSESPDSQFLKIAAAQNAAGAFTAAQESISEIRLDKIRHKALSQQLFAAGPIFEQSGAGLDTSNPATSSGGPAGLSGGITQADFFPLITLIQTTIDPDGWIDVGGEGALQAFPAGVYADSSGTLNKLKIDSRRSLKSIAKNAGSKNKNRRVGISSKLRKISLNRLEKHAQMLAASGQAIDDEIQNMAGMYEIEYVMFLPETGDVVIAGPAGDWTTDNDGHAVNVDTGKPVLQLDDLVVCLRNAQSSPQGNFGKFGCSITPRKQELAATRKFLADTKLKGKAWRNALRKTLGQQDIEVFGIDPATHAGMVLVEADYRMKLVAMGLEPTIPEIPSYLSRLTVGPNGEVEPMDVVRWWFTMNYDQITADTDRNAFQLVGTGVKVLSENEFINDQGDRIHTGQSKGPTAGFARDFTEHFNKIADEYPVYRRLKNLFDLSIVSALIRTHGLNIKANWNLTYFGNDPVYQDFVYQPATAAVPVKVDSVLNHRVVSQRKRSSTLKTDLVGISGGITFDAIEVLRSRSTVAVESSNAFAPIEGIEQNIKPKRWWWD